MDLVKTDIKKLYARYLAAAFGSAMIGAVYSIVDMAVVGQYQGPQGTAALAVVAPIWNIIFSLGLMTGIGGSVLFGAARGRGEMHGADDEAFTASLLLALVLSLVCWGVVAFADEPLLRLFGADDALLPLTRRYLLPVKFAVPLFLFTQFLSAFLRNDGSPALATGAVLTGGIFNIFGDCFFVFGCDLGIFGAGLATVLGALVSFPVLLVHFFRRKCTLRLAPVARSLRRTGAVLVNGFSSFVIDVAMGILTMIFNRQIMKYSNADALAVYGIIINIGTVVQCCAYSVGQATQPILSFNGGAGRWDRVRETLRCALVTTTVFGLVWTALMLAFPNGFVRLFMAPSEQVLAIAPRILRSYGISFLLLPLNVFSTYYFQALMKPGVSLAVSLARGVLVSGALLFALPACFGVDALWLAMPVTELVVAAAVIVLMARYTKQLCSERSKTA